MTKKLKIISDGTRQGTYLVDGDGNVVEGVTNITWSCSVHDGPAKTTIGFLNVPVELEVIMDKSNVKLFDRSKGKKRQ